MTSSLGIEPAPHWWEASALTTSLRHPCTPNFEAISQALHQLPLSSGLVNIASQEDFDAAWEV